MVRRKKTASNSRFRILLGAFCGLVVLLGIALYETRGRWMGPAAIVLNLKPKIEKTEIAKALSDKSIVNDFPKELTLDLKGRPYPVSVEYATHDGLTNEIKDALKSYNPDYAAFVAMDATTGRILSVISYSQQKDWANQNLALRATFPSASVFKVVTASAAIAERKMNASSIVSFNGRAHTLYKSNIFKETENRWTTRMTLKEAFAHSVNTVFGKLGVFIVGPSELKTYAEKFGFNRKLASDLPMEESQAAITEDPWELAEAASGFTKNNRMSPLQGALIAAAIANDGKLMEPYIVNTMKNSDGEVVYESTPTLSATVIDPQAAEEMKELMRETVASGTSRGSFRGFKKSQYGFVDVGGKTGSLTGNDPAGRYDWFVGYGASGEHRLAVASLIISKEYWKVKSSVIARKAIEYYFREKFGLKTMGRNRKVAANRGEVALTEDSVGRKHHRGFRHRRRR